MLQSCRRQFLADRDRWFLWVPVFLGLGAVIYYQLPFEPDARLVASLSGLAAVLVVIACRTGHGPRLLAICLCLTIAGFDASVWRSARVATMLLQEELGPRRMAGRVQTVELADRGPRVVLDRVAIEDWPSSQTPARIRLRLTKYSVPPAPGSVISLKADLMPPAGPAAPGAHDFRRDAWFAGIGGVGYALSRPRLLSPALPSGPELWLETMRQRIAAHVEAALGRTPEAAIATAYLTGERGLIDDQTANDMRNSGLAHLLAISGMKVGLLAVLAFAFVRYGLALWPALALRVPVRKIAAIAAIGAAIAYTVLAASPVPALRSVLMTGMAMFAIIVDRQSISLRLAAIAASLVILWQPEAVIGASFQMSFGAVVALIAFYEAYRQRLRDLYAHSGRWRRYWLGFMRVLVTTLVATMVTSPLALFHFQQEANYSVIANAIAIPLNDFWIMPFEALAALTMPLGLDTLPMQAAGQGIHLMLVVASTVSAWPASVTRMPDVPGAVLALWSLGALWLIIWRHKWRHLGWLAVAAGIGAIWLSQKPILLVTEDARRVAFLDSSDRLAVNRIGKHDFTVDAWKKFTGATAAVKWADSGSGIACDAVACRQSGNWHIVVAVDAATVTEACGEDATVIVPFASQTVCGATQVIDLPYLRAHGGTAIYREGDGLAIKNASQAGTRPWTLNIAASAPQAAPEPRPGPDQTDESRTPD